MDKEALRTLADVRAFLKRFGTWIYTGDVQGDRELIQEEVDELHELGIIDREKWLTLRHVIATHSPRD